MNKTLLAALVLSPCSKAVTVVDEKQWLVVQDLGARLSVFLVDLRKGDVTHCREEVAGIEALQSWVYNCVFDIDVDVMEKRWETLEAMRERMEQERQIKG